MSDVGEENGPSGQYLTFASAGQDYAIPITRMREIVPYTGSTKVPLAPAVIRGLINLRGRAIPVVDLSVRFGKGETSVTKRTCVLIVDLDDGEVHGDVGILAESVSRVLEVRRDELEETPSFGMGVARECLSGIVRAGEEFVPVLDVPEVLNTEAEVLARLAADDDTPDAAEDPPGPTADAAETSDPGSGDPPPSR